MARWSEKCISGSHQRPGPDSGHLLVGLMVLIAVMLIMLTVAGQSWTFLVRRDAEAELIFRGEQYAAAIEFYKKENATYPLELDVLGKEGPHRHRYIRKLWPDPLAKDGKWGKLYLSPDGKGFLNPFATPNTLDPFAADGLEPLGLPGQQGAGKPAWGAQSQNVPPGYTALDMLGLDERGGEMQGLPIVGVVHKQREIGVKIYKNQASLNDWAFTLMLIDPKLQTPSMYPPPPNVPLSKGVGDIQRPVFIGRRPGEGPPGVLNPILKIREMAKQNQREQDRRKAEEKARSRAEHSREPPPDDDQYDEQEASEEEPDQYQENEDDSEAEEDAGDEGEPSEDDPNAPEDDPNAPADPNAVEDPNAPAPNAGVS